MLSRQFFYRYLFSPRAGSVIRIISRICLAGTAIGVFALIVVMSVMSGFSDTIKRRLLAVEPHLLIDVTEPVKEKESGALTSLINELNREPGAEAQVAESQDVIVRTNEGHFGGAVTRGLAAGPLQKLLIRLDEIGRDNREDGYQIHREITDLVPQEGEVLMGVDLIRSLGILEGDYVTLVTPESLLLPPGETPMFEKVRVKAAVFSRLADVDSKFIFYQKGKALQNLSEAMSRKLQVEVMLKDADNYARLENVLRSRGYKTQSWVERNSSLFYALKMEKMVMTTFLSLTTLIASFSIITVMVLLLTQKKQDIGILMTLGLSLRDTKRLFSQLGLFLSLIGLGGGLFLGVLVCWTLKTFPLNILPDIYYDSTIPVNLEYWKIAIVFAGCLFVAFLSSWIPAKLYMKLSPTDALRLKVHRGSDR